MSSSLSIRTLGSTEILLDRSLVTDFDSRKVTAILIYLGCTGHTCLREVLSMDTLREKTYRHLMLLLAHSGEREAALEQYERCRQLLAYELGTAETTVVYEQIRNGAPTETAEPVAVPPTTAREIDNPCRDLRTSQEADAGDFFGREQLTERLLERIAENGPFSKFLAAGRSIDLLLFLIAATTRESRPDNVCQSLGEDHVQAFHFVDSNGGCVAGCGLSQPGTRRR